LSKARRQCSVTVFLSAGRTSAEVKFSWIRPDPRSSFLGIQHLKWEILYLKIEIQHPILTGKLLM